MARAGGDVWFVGSSLIERLRRYVGETRSRDFSFELDSHIVWMGRGGMCWRGAMCCLQAGLNRPKPRVIVLHVGGNDLGRDTGIEIGKRIKRDLRWVLNAYPETTILFSYILPRSTFRNQRNDNPRGLNRAARIINREVGKFLIKQGHGVVRHSQIQLKANVIDEKGVHLNHRGNEIFLKDFQDALASVARPRNVQ